LLEGADRLAQTRVGAGRHPELEGGGEHRPGEVRGQHLQDRPGATSTGGQAGRGVLQLLPSGVAQVLDGCEDQIGLGREVVQLGTAAHPGPLGHQRRRRTAPPELDQALERCVQKALTHRAGAFLLGHPGSRRHPAIVTANKQTVKPDCLRRSGQWR
jgi:hypothetical protein